MNEFLFRKVDNTPLVLFRILFGLVMFFETVGAVAIGWVDQVFIDPQFTFTFIGLEFLQPLPKWGMYSWYFAMGILAIGICIGYRYRLSSILFGIMWSYPYLIHKAQYNNHHYLMWMLLFMMAIVPADRSRSMDVKQGRVKEQHWCRHWHIKLFVGLLLVVYTYAAIAKIYPDWIAGIPLDIWFGSKHDHPVLGWFFRWESSAIVMSWGGILFDLLVIPALLFRKTRLLAVIASFAFHIMNSLTFQIGTFPYLMLGSLVLFYNGKELKRIFLKKKQEYEAERIDFYPRDMKLTKGLLFLFFIVQLLLPLRHHLYDSNVYWSEEGHRLSWRMMLRAKQASSSFTITTTEGKTIRHDPKNVLTHDQFYTMSGHPDMIWQYVQYLKEEYGSDSEIYVTSKVRLNRKSLKKLIDPNVDMAKEKWRRFEHHKWILPVGDS